MMTACIVVATQSRCKVRAKAEQRRTKGRAKAEQRRNKGRAKAEQRQSKGRAKAEQRRTKGGPKAEQWRLSRLEPRPFVWLGISRSTLSKPLSPVHVLVREFDAILS